ncbi:MAG: ABC transporter permease [Oscillospiraceae bacterium]|nr:ABC transporter permease [Oscillospiraceae bacterium]MDE7171474.1 ABC transporter permease [Oscillospiraceae bacterium]
MRVRAFAKRNMKELFRDPLTLFFGLGFPLALLLLMTVIQRNVPVSIFELDTLAPGIALFGLTFMALFSGMLLAKDRSSAFLARLAASPMTAADFLLGYLLPLLPMAVGQSVICLAAAVALGLPLSWNLLAVVASLIPSALLFIALGLLCGTLFNDKQVGGMCGALLTNVTAFLAGIWFDLSLIGGGFKTFAYLLPFAHGADGARAALAGNWAALPEHLLWVSVWAAAVLALAIILFRGRLVER